MEEQESELTLGRSGGSSDRSRRRSGEAEEKESAMQSGGMQKLLPDLLPDLRLSHFVLTDEHNVTLYGTRLVYDERKRLSDVIATDVAATDVATENQSNNQSNNENDELFSSSSSSFSMPAGLLSFFSFFFFFSFFSFFFFFFFFEKPSTKYVPTQA